MNATAIAIVGEGNAIVVGKSCLCSNPQVVFVVFYDIVNIIVRQSVLFAEGQKFQSVKRVDSSSKCPHPHVTSRVLNDAIYLRLSDAVFYRIILEIILLCPSVRNDDAGDQELKKTLFQGLGI